MTTQNETNWYGNVFKTWQAKLLGPKPTNEQLANIHNLGARPGKQALACAMALRECGVTGAQIIIACGAPQNNKRAGFITDGLLKRIPTSPSAEGHTVYKCELTPKGLKRIETRVKAGAEAEAETVVEPVKAKAKAKAKPKAASKAKGKGKAAEAATVAAEAENAPAVTASPPEATQTPEATADAAQG
jgi:hypothetical protein